MQCSTPTPPRSASPPLLWFLSTFPPLRMLSRGLIGMANVFLPGKGLKEGPFTSEEEIRTLADVAANEEVIEREERRLIHSIFEFGDTVVREVMVPRPDMVGVEEGMSLEEALQKAIEAGKSRLPVFRENHDNIVGLVYLKDMARVLTGNGEGEGGLGLASLVRPASSFPSRSGWRNCCGRCRPRSSTWPSSSTSTAARRAW